MINIKWLNNNIYMIMEVLINILIVELYQSILVIKFKTINKIKYYQV